LGKLVTGFDVPTCSTIYLDKPMKSHTLMQTIARANRVAPGKAAGLIVDYVGTFRNLQKALAIYARQRGGQTELPIKDKHALVEGLRESIADAGVFGPNRPKYAVGLGRRSHSGGTGVRETYDIFAGCIFLGS